MGIFDNLKQAEFFENGERAPDGDHIVQITKCSEIQSRQMNVPVYVVEYIILESTSAVKGKAYSWPQNYKDPKRAQGNVKQFVLAVLKADKEKDAAHYAKCEDQCEAAGQASITAGLFNGQTVKLNVTTVKTKANQDFKRHTWRPHVAA